MVKNRDFTGNLIALNVGMDDLNFQVGRPEESALNDALSQGRPVYIWQNAHIMTIDAVRLNETVGAFEYRFINIDNNGVITGLF